MPENHNLESFIEEYNEETVIEDTVELDIGKQLKDDAEDKGAGADEKQNCWWEFDGWDPMNKDFNSVQNVLKVDQETPGEFLLEIKERKLQTKDILCRFFDKTTGGCWKGRSCRYSHVEVDPLDLGKEAIETTCSLDEKFVLHVDMHLEVTVQHVVSPSEFYVVPTRGPGCLCCRLFRNVNLLEKGLNYGSFVPRDRTLRRNGNPLTEFEKLKRGLKHFLEKEMLWQKKQNPYFTKNQLVAVRRVENTSKTWYRGVIMDDLVRVHDREIPFRKVYLMDVGKTVTVRCDEMCSLPTPFSHTAAMAIKCCLSDIVPVGLSWTDACRNSFSNLMIPGNPMVVAVTKPSLDIERHCRFAEKDPYLVDVFIPQISVPEHLRYQNLQTFSITNILASEGLGIKLSATPYLPRLEFVFDLPLLLNPLVKVPLTSLSNEKKHLRRCNKEPVTRELSSLTRTSCYF